MTTHRTRHGVPRSDTGHSHSRSGARLPRWMTHCAIPTADRPIDPDRLEAHRRLIEQICWPTNALQVRLIRAVAAAFDRFIAREQAQMPRKRNGHRGLGRIVMG